MGDWKVYLGRKTVGGVLRTFRVDVRDPKGGRRRLELNTTDEVVARKEMDRWIAEVLPFVKEDYERAGKPAAAPETANGTKNPPLSAIIEYYTKTYLPSIKRAKPKSTQKSTQILRDFELWCGQERIGRIQQCGRAVIDRYQADLSTRVDNKGARKSAKTVALYMGTVRACFNAAVDGELIEQSPVKRFAMPRVPEVEKTTLSLGELQGVLEAIQEYAPEILPPVIWIVLTGNRPSDVVDLRWKQVDLERGFVERTQVKVSKLAQFPIPSAAVALLKRLRTGGPNDQVFRVWGQAMTVNGLYRRFTRALIKAKFARPVNLLDLRNTYATQNANDMAMPIQMLQVQMGHNKIETTLLYNRRNDSKPYVDRWGDRVLPGPLFARITEKIAE